MARTNIAVDEATADSLADEATKENKSLYAITNEALTAVLKICGYGRTPQDIYPAWRFSRILKDTDAIPMPGDLLEKITKKVYSSDKDWLLKEWYDEGKHIGSYLRMYAEEFQLLASRVEELYGFLPVKRVEFERKDSSGKFEIVIRVIGAGLSIESTSCAEQFLLGILSNYPYKIVSSRTAEGIIEVRAHEEKERKIVS